MQPTPSSPNKKGKYFLKTTQPNSLAKAEKMPPRKQRRRSEEPKLHKLADKLTEILIYFMVIFSPWAFGTTESWSICTMNISAYALGILLVTKWITRLAKKFNANSGLDRNELSPNQLRLRIIQKTCNILLACSIALLLSYILTSAINAQASYNFESKEYTYFKEVNKNLPHSYDARGTWLLFWQYLGLIILFLATRDWYAGAKLTQSSMHFNPRLKRLLILICFNGGAIALECILQRIFFGEHRGKLLFLLEPAINSENILHFGPFAYRSNASSYLNLIWPISLGLLIQMGRENLEYRKKRMGSGPELLLIPCIILAASGPMISSARGGALVMVGLLILSSFSLLLLGLRSFMLRSLVPIVLLISLIISYYFGWEKVEPRLINIFSDNMSNRMQLYEKILAMINEYGIFGSGPGSFEAIIQFELSEDMNQWHSWAHNDYLEFYLTFGKVGGVIICTIIIIFLANTALFLILNYEKPIFLFVLIAIIGVATHAAADFPLQVSSINILLIILAAVVNIKNAKY